MPLFLAAGTGIAAPSDLSQGFLSSSLDLGRILVLPTGFASESWRWVATDKTQWAGTQPLMWCKRQELRNQSQDAEMSIAQGITGQPTFPLLCRYLFTLEPNDGSKDSRGKRRLEGRDWQP